MLKYSYTFLQWPIFFSQLHLFFSAPTKSRFLEQSNAFSKINKYHVQFLFCHFEFFLHFIYFCHISEPLLKYPFKYFHIMLQQNLNTPVTSTWPNISFFCRLIQVTPSPAFKPFSWSNLSATSANFFTVLFLHNLNNLDVMPLSPAAFPAFRRFRASITAFSNTFSQGSSTFSTFNFLLHSVSSFSNFQTCFSISIFTTNAWYSNNIFVVFLALSCPF